MQEDTGKKPGSHAAGTALLIFLLVYFLFPMVFILPIALVYNPKGSLPRPVEKFFKVFFWPQDYLYRHVPIYHQLLDAERRWAGF